MLLKLIVNGTQVSDLYVKNDLHVYHVFTLTVNGFKNHETLSVYRGHVRQTL